MLYLLIFQNVMDLNVMDFVFPGQSGAMEFLIVNPRKMNMNFVVSILLFDTSYFIYIILCEDGDICNAPPIPPIQLCEPNPGLW